MPRSFVSFDWALKRLLRAKANHVVMEGFLSELLKRDIRIQEILESESNQDDANDQQNRVDLLVLADGDEILIIEVQVERQDDFLQRLIFGTAKVMTEHLRSGRPYADLPKVISVALVYFSLGHGKDWAYHGTTRLIGLNQHDELDLAPRQLRLLGSSTRPNPFPDYYLLRINDFNGVARTPLEQWVHFLKTSDLPETVSARGLAEAGEALAIMRLPAEARRAWEHYERDLHQRASMVESTFGAGLVEGEQIGLEKGRAEGQRLVVDNLLDLVRQGIVPSETALAQINRLEASGAISSELATAARQRLSA